MEIKEDNEIKLVSVDLDGKGKWPYYKGKKALSASALTKFIREIEYQEVPINILLAAARKGKFFHDVIQEFCRKNLVPDYSELWGEELIPNKLKKQIIETVGFFEQKKHLLSEKFLGSETLHYVLYKDELLATYVDLDFSDSIIELKTNYFRLDEDNLIFLTFEIQLIIQLLCTGKKTYLLWSTGEGVIFREYKISPWSLKIIDLLIELHNNNDLYDQDEKKIILEKIKSRSTLLKIITKELNQK